MLKESAIVMSYDAEPLSTVKYPRFAISLSKLYLKVKYQLPAKG